MDRKIIELAKAKWELVNICNKQETTCLECPVYNKNTGMCIGQDRGSYRDAVETMGTGEEQTDREEIPSQLDETAELEKAKKALNDYCDTQKNCSECVFRNGDWCDIGCTVPWASKSKEQPEPEAKETLAPSFAPAEKRKRVLDDAIDAVCRDRCEMYGEVEDNFGVIAELWNAYLNAGLPEGACKVDLGAKRVAEMMILFKVGRAATAMEDHRDTYVDIAGYAACAGGVCDEKDV